MEFSGQEYLNDQRTQEMLLGLLATAAREESETKSRRKLQGLDARAARGEVNGRAPWGYDIGTVEGLRVLVPNALGRKWIPQVYRAAVNGKSLQTIAIMLAKVPGPSKEHPWSEEDVRRVIHNATYCGNRPGKGNMEYEPLVSAELWQQANLAVKSRFRQGRKTLKREPALVKPVCGSCYGIVREGAPSGQSPMYVVNHTKGEYVYYHYVCKGHGPHRKSCGGPVIRQAALEEAVDTIMAADTRPHWALEYVPGDDNAEKLARLNDAIALAGRSGDYTKVAELAAEAEAVRQQPHRKGRTEKRYTGLTVGQHWASLDRAGKREELLKWEVVAWRDQVALIPLTERGARPLRDEPGTIIGDIIAGGAE
jgi:hypothetical protein